MEYNVEAGPAKYLVGTEQGIVLSINLRKRKSNDCVVPMDMGSGKHHGPIYSIQRNPRCVTRCPILCRIEGRACTHLRRKSGLRHIARNQNIVALITGCVG